MTTASTDTDIEETTSVHSRSTGGVTTETTWVTQTAPSSNVSNLMDSEVPTFAVTPDNSQAAKTCFFKWQSSEPYCYVIYAVVGATILFLLGMVCALCVYTRRIKSKLQTRKINSVEDNGEDVKLMIVEQKTTKSIDMSQVDKDVDDLPPPTTVEDDLPPPQPLETYPERQDDEKEGEFGTPQHKTVTFTPPEPPTEWPAPMEEPDCENTSVFHSDFPPEPEQIESSFDQSDNPEFTLSEEQNVQLDSMLSDFMQIANTDDLNSFPVSP